MQEMMAGLKVTGDWEDLVDTAEQIGEVLKTSDAEDESVEDWEHWRPRKDERFRKEVRDKTVEQACVKENTVEKEGKTARQEAGEAVEDIGEAVGNVAKGRPDQASQKTQEAVNELVLSVDTAARKLVRRCEAFLYRHIVTRTNPYYFESRTVTASLQENKTILHAVWRKNGSVEYELAVQIEDEDMCERVRTELKETA